MSADLISMLLGGMSRKELIARARYMEECNARQMQLIFELRSVPTATQTIQPFILGNQYRTQGGKLVRFVSVHNEGTSSETMADESGWHRYTKRDFGRGTGTAHDYSDPSNTPPLYTVTPIPAPVGVPAGKDRYFVYDAANCYNPEFIETDAGRDRVHREAIANYRRDAALDQEWDTAVEGIVSGVITHGTGAVHLGDNSHDFQPHAIAAPTADVVSIYQVWDAEKLAWFDVDGVFYRSRLPSHRRIVYATAGDAVLTTALESTERMFHDACASLGLITEALGLDLKDAGPDPILAAIEQLKAGNAAPVDDAAPDYWARKVLVPLTGPVSIHKAMLGGKLARVVLSGGTGPVAAVHLVNIGVSGWIYTEDTAEAFAKGFNMAASWMQDAMAYLIPTVADTEDAAKYRAINTPEIDDFMTAVRNEALHQRERWKANGDEGKGPPDWFWLLGNLAGKALRPEATPDKVKHHIIATAAACCNWHGSVTGNYAAMRPGIGADIVSNNTGKAAAS